MKLRKFGWVAMAATLSLGAMLVSQTAQAQGFGQPGAGQGIGGGKRGGKQGGGRGGQMVAMRAALEAIGLSDDQKAKIKTITEQFATDARGLRDLDKDARPAKTRELTQKMMTDVNAVLTPAQQEQFKDEIKKARQNERQQGGAMGPFGPLLQSLDLTDDQKTKVEPIVKEATGEMMKLMEAEPKGPSPEKMEKQKGIVDATKAKIRPLLTPDQQTKLDNYKERRPRPGGRRPGGQGGPGAPPPPAV